MTGITTSGILPPIINGRPVININTTIPPVDPTLDTDISLYCSSAINGTVTTNVNRQSGMMVELNGSAVDVNPPNMTNPSKIVVKTPITYRGGKSVSFTGPPTTTTPPFIYNMYSSVGVFTVDASGNSFKFTMPATMTTPISDNKVAIYANTNKAAGLNPFSVFAETSIRDYTADLPANKKVLYACAYNKGTILRASSTSQVNIFFNVTQNMTLDSLDFGYMLPVFRPVKHVAGFKSTSIGYNSLFVYVNANATNYGYLRIDTFPDFNAMYDSSDISGNITGKNDGSLLTIPFAASSKTLATNVYKASSDQLTKLNFVIGDQLLLNIAYLTGNGSNSINWDVVTTNASSLTGSTNITNNVFSASGNEICCSIICNLNGSEQLPELIAANFGMKDAQVVGGNGSNFVNATSTSGMIVTGKSLLSGFLFNGFKVTSSTTTPLPVSIPVVATVYQGSVDQNGRMFQIFFDYRESSDYTSSSPLYIPFSYTEYNRINSGNTQNTVLRIDPVSLCFNGRQNPLFNQNTIFFMQITAASGYTYTYKTLQGTTTSGSLYGIVVPSQTFQLINNSTIKYNGVFPSTTTAPYIINGNPRGTSENFAIMTNDSMPLLKTYAIAIGKLPANRTTAETNAVTAFTSGSALVPFNNIVTTFVTNMDSLFANNATFNEAIGSWDTSSVTSMNQMFYAASIFNQPIGSWNTEKVMSMSTMFQSASAFNQPIGSWNTANVTNMAGMFYAASAFNSDIGSWNTAKVTSMNSMLGAAAFNQPIGSWNTTNVKDMTSMFNAASIFNQNIGSWNTSNVTNMANMFLNATAFNQNIGSWNTSNVTDMSNMFYNARMFNQPIGSWLTGNVKDMRGMFQDAAEFNQTIGSWSTLNVTNMSGMFYGAAVFNQPILFWKTSNVRSMSGMFLNAIAFNQPIFKNSSGAITVGEDPNFNWYTRNVTDMSYMFFGATSFNQQINVWTTVNVTNMSYMFTSASKFNNAGFGLISNNNVEWNTSNVIDMTGMFMSATVFNVSVDFWNVSKVASMSNMFQDARAFNQYSINNWRPSNVVAMSSMFYRAVNFNQPLSGWDDSVRKVAYIQYMFYGAISFNQNLSNWRLDAIERESPGARAGLYVGFNQLACPMSVGNRPYESRGTSNIRFPEYLFTNSAGQQVL
jgi:surface protein